MIYYKIEIDCQLMNVKRLSLAVPLFKVLHKLGAVEIYNNPVSGKWSTLYRSNPKDNLSAEIIGPQIRQFYQSEDFFLHQLDPERIYSINASVFSKGN